MGAFLKGIVVFFCIFVSVKQSIANGGWMQQDILLKSGWNMVWLEVDPIPEDPPSVMRGVDYESIWTFVAGRVPEDRGIWVSYARNQPDFLNTLHHMQGNRGYLINVKSPASLNITGRPVNRTYWFSEGHSNLFGTDKEPASTNSPTFNDYFSHPNIKGKVSSIYKMDGETFTEIGMDSPIQENIAYWVSVLQRIQGAGPIKVGSSLSGYQFGTDAYIHEVSVEVPVSDIDQALTVKALPSAMPPPGQLADAGDGDVSWLEYYDSDDSDSPWKSLSTGVTFTVPAGEVNAGFSIRCVRKGRSPATEELTSSLYQGLVEIADSKGNRVVLGAGMEVLPVEGMWIGQAKLTQVSTFDGIMADATPLYVSLILALPEAGQGDPQLLDKFSIDVDRDGRTLRYRYNAILFHEPVTLTGSVDGYGTAGRLQGTISMDEKHALNPYRHRYNPEHRKGYPVTRDIEMTFSATDDDPVSQALRLDQSVGNNELVGTYSEDIMGVSLRPIRVSGPFKLFRLGDVTLLN